MNVREGVGVLDEYIYNICRKLHTTMYSDSHDIYIYIHVLSVYTKLIHITNNFKRYIYRYPSKYTYTYTQLLYTLFLSLY